MKEAALADLDLAALRRHVTCDCGNQHDIGPADALSLLDQIEEWEATDRANADERKQLLARIEELERIIHFERHFCRWVDCGASTLEHTTVPMSACSRVPTAYR